MTGRASTMKKRRATVHATARPVPGSLFTDPLASVVTGKRDGKMPEVESLPFVKRRQPKGTGYCYWVVNPSGNYARDCQTGNDYARLLLPHLKYNGGIVLLGSIVLDMIKAGDAENGKGLVVGFMGELSRELSKTRSSLAFAAAAFSPKAPARLKKMWADSWKPTLKVYADAI
jgi:hypothetical protein